jgi:hypothetical protein
MVFLYYGEKIFNVCFIAAILRFWNPEFVGLPVTSLEKVFVFFRAESRASDCGDYKSLIFIFNESIGIILKALG